MSDKHNANGAVDISQIEEDLVAYLDGELGQEETRAVEERLARDPAARKSLQRLEQTWEALETLPRPDLDENFTRSTVEMIAVEADREVTQQMAAVPNRKRRMWLAIGGGTLLAALVGFLVVNVAVGDPNQQLLADLGVLERIEVYREVGTIEFLRDLDTSGLLSDNNLADVPLPPPTAEPPEAMPASIAERRARVEKMSPAEKDQLKRRGEWLAELDEAARTQLRTLDAALAADPQAASLERLMDRYHRLLSSLPPESQRNLRSMAADDRIPYIRELLNVATSRRELTEAEMHWVGTWARQKYGRDDPRTKTFESPSPWSFGGRRFGDRGGWGRTPFEHMTPAEFAELEKGLSQKSRDLLDKIPELNERKGQLGNWIMFTFQKRMANRPRVSDAALREFFLTKLSDTQRYKLEALPPERFTEELTRLYRGPSESGKKGEFPKIEFPKKGDRPEGRPEGAPKTENTKGDFPKKGDRPDRPEGPFKRPFGEGNGREQKPPPPPQPQPQKKPE
jgi:hypothetical protein